MQFFFITDPFHIHPVPLQRNSFLLYFIVVRVNLERNDKDHLFILFYEKN